MSKRGGRLMPRCTLNVARTDSGYLIRVEGDGTAQESPTLAAFVHQYLQADLQPSVVVDLSSCQYLDSTVLGCLLSLQRRCRDRSDSRFVVVADLQQRRRLLSTTRLDKVLELVESAPETQSQFVVLSPTRLRGTEFGRHVMESHLALAKLPCAHAPLFQEIADRLARELAGQRQVDEESEDVRETV